MHATVQEILGDSYINYLLFGSIPHVHIIIIKMLTTVIFSMGLITLLQQHSSHDDDQQLLITNEFTGAKNNNYTSVPRL